MLTNENGKLLPANTRAIGVVIIVIFAMIITTMKTVMLTNELTH